MTTDDKPLEDVGDPDTSTDAGQDQDLVINDPPMSDAAGFGAAVPVAQEAPSDEPAPPQDVRVVPPRSFPQHFSLLFAASMIFIGCLSVWHRAPVFAQERAGSSMISGSFLLALSFYSIILGLLNVLQGRLRGMGSAFMLGILSLYFAFKTMMLTLGQEAVEIGGVKLTTGWVAYSDINAETFQDKVTGFIGQLGPGMLLTMLGGFIIIFVFIKAMMPTGQAQPTPPPRTRRRR